MMKTSFLDFEQPVADLETKIDELRFVQDDSALDISEEIERLRKKSESVTKEIYSKLIGLANRSDRQASAASIHI